MKRLLVLLGLAAACTAARCGPGAHGPNGEHLEGPAAAAPGGLARLPDGSVHVPMLAQRRLGLRTVLAQAGAAAASVELPGRVLMDPNAGGRVQTLVGGKVEAGPRGLPVAGQAVRRGEVLARIAHHADPIALANQAAQLAEIRANRKLAAQRLQRLQALEGTVPRKEIDAARAELESLGQREHAIGASLHAREALVAPITGVVARAEVVAGQVVESSDVLFEVIDPGRLLVEATTPDPALAPQIEGATLAGVPDAQLAFLGAARALRDGVLPLSFRVSSPAGALPLAIGQPVTVVARLKRRVQGIVLPAQALTRSPVNEPVVWIKAGAERYVPQPVQYQVLDAQNVVVTHGLAADNRVVVQGAALIAQIR